MVRQLRVVVITKEIVGMPDEVPAGYCQCECGQRTSLAPFSHKAAGYKKGQPHKYVRGHSPRIEQARQRQERLRTPTKPCACGCGQLVRESVKYYPGHNLLNRFGPET